MALSALQPAAVRLQFEGCLIQRAHQDVQKFLAEGHMRVQFTSFYAAGFISERARAIAPRYCRARSSITSNRPSFTLLASTSSPPTATAQAPALRNSPAVSRFTPPVGIISMCGNGPLSALMYFGPPTFPQGKILTMSAPASHAVTTSEGVTAPGPMTFEYRFT